MVLINGPEVKFCSNNPEYLVVFLHGYGADGYNLLSLAEDFKNVVPNAVFCAPNAPFMLDRFGYQWFSLEDRSKEKMLNGLDIASEYLGKYINHQINRFNIKESNVILIGFSQGTMLSLHYSLLKNNNIKAVIGFSGRIIFDAKREYSSEKELPILLVHGEQDDIIPVEDCYETNKILSSLSYNPEYYICENLAHSINGEGIEEARIFLSVHLKK